MPSFKPQEVESDFLRPLQRMSAGGRFSGNAEVSNFCSASAQRKMAMRLQIHGTHRAPVQIHTMIR